jgi:trk system potassium uptake protein TrkH
MFKFLKKFKISPYLAVLLSFLLVILFGSLLLSFPIAYQDKEWHSYANALFLSTSCVCVTGLNVYPDVLNTMSTFGKVVMAILIQIGGLGFISIFTFIFTIFNRKLAANERYILKEALSFNSYAKVLTFVRSMVLISLVVEFAGTIPFLFVFIPQYGVPVGIGKAVFQSISAFNNAGFDLVGDSSLIPYSNNYIIMLNTSVIIILGGLGFPVILDLLRNRRPKYWTVHTKVVLLMTFILLIVGWLSIWLLNFKNPNPMSLLVAFFQSTTARTAGFTAYPIAEMSPPSRIIMMILMIIGVGPLSTGGGIKITTLFIIIVTIGSFLRGRKSSAFHRSFSIKTFIQAVTIVLIVSIAIILSFTFISFFEAKNTFMHDHGYGNEALIFEVISAFSTTGLSWGITPSLSLGSKLFLIALMFFGRVGPLTIMSVVSASMNKKITQKVSYIETDLVVG